MSISIEKAKKKGTAKMGKDMGDEVAAVNVSVPDDDCMACKSGCKGIGSCLANCSVICGGKKRKTLKKRTLKKKTLKKSTKGRTLKKKTLKKRTLKKSTKKINAKGGTATYFSSSFPSWDASIGTSE
jgi:hypothetical protein